MAAWKEVGVKRVIVRASIESETKKAIARQQCEMVAQARLELHIYGWPYWGDSISAQVRAHCDLVFGLPVKRYWLDCEASDIMWTVDEMLAKIREAVDAATIPAGIYTTLAWWRQWTGHTDAFATLPLWYAHYDYDPTFADFSPGAGWDKPEMKQYNDRSQFGDMNVYLEV